MYSLGSVATDRPSEYIDTLRFSRLFESGNEVEYWFQEENEAEYEFQEESEAEYQV